MPKSARVTWAVGVADLVAALFTLLILPQHGFSSDLIVPIFEKYNQRSYYVAISKADSHKNLEYISTIHQGIDLLFLGRIHPEKGRPLRWPNRQECH